MKLIGKLKESHLEVVRMIEEARRRHIIEL